MITEDVILNSQQLHAQLAHYIYQDQTLWDYIQRPAYGALIVFIYGLLVAVPKDSARARVRRYGRVVDGPELVSAAEFNRRTPSDGVGFDHIESGWFNRLRRQSVMQVRIPREMERYHIMIVGDTGSGKSALFRQLLMQIRARGEAAIVYDPAMEYLPQFYDARRGDIILNPLDARAPYAQLQEAGMQTAQLTEIIRQQDPALKATVEQLSVGDVDGAIRSLAVQGRVHE